MTVSRVTRRLIALRSGGMCEICGSQKATNVHHRKPRRMGGSNDPVIDSVVNLLHLCGSGTTGCHGRIESNRLGACTFGWLVHDYDDPAVVPVRFALGWGLLTAEGGYKAVTAPEWQP